MPSIMQYWYNHKVFPKEFHPYYLSAQLSSEASSKINISSVIAEDDSGGSGKDSILTRMRSIS